MKNLYFALSFVFTFIAVHAQTVLQPDQVFDGNEIHKNWIVIVRQNRISYAGPAENTQIPKDAEYIVLKGKNPDARPYRRPFSSLPPSV